MKKHKNHAQKSAWGGGPMVDLGKLPRYVTNQKPWPVYNEIYAWSFPFNKLYVNKPALSYIKS